MINSHLISYYLKWHVETLFDQPIKISNKRKAAVPHIEGGSSKTSFAL